MGRLAIQAEQGAVFPNLDKSSLCALELLGSPIYIYSFAAQRFCWANDAALNFWNAPSVDELRDRVLAPYSLATNLRLDEYLAAFRRGERRMESWTYYPKGQAVSALARCTGVQLDGHAEAMLVEVQTLDPIDVPISEVRAIEALRHTPMMISMFAEDGSELLRNPAAKRFFAQIEGDEKNAQGMFRSMFADIDDYHQLMNDVRNLGVARRNVAIKNPATPVHSVQLQKVSDPGTGQPAYLVVQQDISELRDITQQLAATEVALDIVLSLNVAPSLLVSAGGTELLKVNYAAEQLLQISGHDHITLPDIFRDSESWRALLNSINENGNCTISMDIFTGRGEVFSAAVSGTRLVIEKDDAILLTVTTASELAQTRTEVGAPLDVERALGVAHGRMLEVASHEFRTPLAIIDGTAQRMARRADKMTPEQIQLGTARIRGIVGRLVGMLDHSIERARKNLPEFHCEPTPGLIQNTVVEVTKYFTDAADIEVAEELAVLPRLAFDQVLVERAFVNLLANAIKYSDGRAQIKISCSIEDGYLALFIRDRGIGILPEQREFVFQDDARGANVGQRPGSGLGLHIVRGIFRAHGGEARIFETDGPGTTVKLVLPLN